MKARTLFNVFLIGALGIPALASAALGEPVGSVQADKTSMRAAGISIRTAARYSVHEIASPSGAVVREYATPEGIIFAVAWEGPTPPDIANLLGQYFAPYAAALRGQRGDHSHAYVNQSELVVQSRGHLRAFSGHAYLRSLLPAGVTPDQLQ